MNWILFFSRAKPLDISLFGSCNSKCLSDEFVRDSNKGDFRRFIIGFESEITFPTSHIVTQCSPRCDIEQRPQCSSPFLFMYPLMFMDVPDNK